MTDDIVYIRKKVDEILIEVGSIRRMTEVELRARRAELEPALHSLFQGRGWENLARCYLEADGVQTQQTIAIKLDVDKATVSRCFTRLRADGMVEPVELDRDDCAVHRRNPSYEKVFRLREWLERKLGGAAKGRSTG